MGTNATLEAYEMGDRLMLHATEISFTHPTTDETINQTCEPQF